MERGSIAFLWGNGGRPLVLSVAAAVLALTILGISFLVTNFWPKDEPFAPLSISNVTINSRVEGVDGPAVHAAEHYNGTLTICNGDDQTHTITFIIQFERLHGDIHFVSGGSLEFPIEPGCAMLTGDSAPLPEAVTPGQWRESTSATVQRGDQKQTVSFVSEPFEVIP